jgi:hypothetical protein
MIYLSIIERLAGLRRLRMGASDAAKAPEAPAGWLRELGITCRLDWAKGNELQIFD